MANEFDRWSLMSRSEALQAIEEHLKKVREKAGGDQIKEAEEKIKAEIQKSNDLDEGFFIDKEAVHLRHKITLRVAENGSLNTCIGTCV